MVNMFFPVLRKWNFEKILLLILVLLIFSSFTLKERLPSTKAGDFIVTQQSKHFSILFIRSLNSSHLELEEITAPLSALKSIKNNWQTWIDQKAPHHTAWVVYTIDLHSNKIKECYSFDRKGWIAIDDRESFITALLSLPLKPMDLSQRKRIGPPPIEGETDRRALWSPPVVIEGKKMNKPSIEVYSAEWPKDETLLSQAKLELYFDAQRSSFLFPCWIEIKTTHYAQNCRVLDSGINLHSFHKFLPPLPVKKRSYEQNSHNR